MSFAEISAGKFVNTDKISVLKYRYSDEFIIELAASVGATELNDVDYVFRQGGIIPAQVNIYPEMSATRPSRILRFLDLFKITYWTNCPMWGCE